MVLAAACFAVMGACVKAASGAFHTFELVFWRGLVGLAVMAAWAAWLRRSPATPRWRMHATRSFTGALSLSGWYYALGHLPLAAAITLNYTSPLFIAALVSAGTLLHGRGRLEPALLGAVALGFGGVALLLRPSFNEGDAFAAAVGLASGAISAVALLQVRALSRQGEDDWKIVFWFCAMQVLFGIVGTLIGGHHDLASYDARGVALIAGIGGSAVVAQMALTRAFGRGRTLLTANLQYLTVVFAAGVGWVAFGEALDTLAVAGICTVLAAGILATVVSARTPG